jgi:hypothetical protein
MFLASCSSTTPETVEEVAGDSTEETSATTETVETIKLEQTEGMFTTESLSLEAGKEYNFEITNNAGRQAAFVLVKAEDAEQAKEDFMSVAIGDAALAGLLEDGETGCSTGTVKLEKGEYVYFCPVNETPQYKLTVK